ncbi:MAG: hypothetical protein M3Q75_04855, partial [Gemmatimonadota bacterium]|nr:hypothetical protein [Gemmatimonadota bacterium]
MQWRKDVGYDDLWYRLGDLYAGKHFEKGLSTEDKIAVNVAFATVNVIYPTVSVNRPQTTVMARDSDQQDRAVIAEAVVNAWWDAYDVLPEFRLSVKDLLICGHGWMKVGYRFNEKEVERPGEEIEEEFSKARSEADEYAAQNPDLAAEVPTDDEIFASIPFTKMVVDEDHPFAERVSPHDVYVDPEATTMASLSWIAQRVVRPVDEVRKDKRYDAGTRKRVTPDRSMNGSWLGPNKKRSEYGDDIQRTTIWEFYDLKAGTISVFAHAGDGFLVKPTKIPYRGGHPFEMLRNYDVPDMFYPMGDLEGIEPLQHELNKTRSQLMNARKQYIRKYLYRDDAFDAKGRAALESDKDGTMIPVQGNIQDFSQAIQPLQTHTIP